MKKTLLAYAFAALFALAPLSAKDSYTVEEFSAMEIDSARSVKIVDSLDEGAQRKLVSALRPRL